VHPSPPDSSSPSQWATHLGNNSNRPPTKHNSQSTPFLSPFSRKTKTNSSPTSMNQSVMPGWSLYSRPTTLTPTPNPVLKNTLLQLWCRSPLPMCSISCPQLTSFHTTVRLKRCTPPVNLLNAPNAGDSATSQHDARAPLQSAHSAPSPTPSRSIAALILPALRVATSTRSLAVAHPWWRAVLTARKSTLHAVGIAPPDQGPLKIDPRHPLNRSSMLWTLLMTRRAWQHPQVLLPTLHSTPRPLYSPTMLRLLGRDPNASSPTSSQESL